MTMKSIGGNRGYIGYSISVNGYNAKREGKYPKTEFKRQYEMSEKIFKSLVENGIVYVSEWHHTSKFGNRTDFYAWECEDFREFYERNTDVVKLMIKNDEDYVSKFEAFRNEQEKYREEEEIRIRKEFEDYKMYVSDYKSKNDNFITPAEFTASNGVVVNTAENIAYYNGERLGKRRCKGMRDEAFAELHNLQNEWKNGLLTFAEWKDNR